MATTLYLSPLSLIVQYFTNLGIIAAGATITTQVAGSVSTLQTTYTDASGLVPNPNPMQLNGAARPAGSSGAVVGFWQPAGVSIDVYFTDTEGETWSIKNLPGINDPTAAGSLQTLLASAASSNAAGSGPVAGADLVANAVKSYDIFADVRAANVPILVTGQTLNISVQGNAAVNDGLGGTFYWSPTSSAADNNTSVLKPTNAGATGRWIRLNTTPFGAQSTLPSAATTDLGTATSNLVSITGSTNISSFGASASKTSPLYIVSFPGNLTLEYSAAILLPGNATNIATLAGDSALCQYLGGGIWQVLAYWRAGTAPFLTQYLVVKPTDQSVTSSIVLVPDTALQVSLQASASYLISVRLQLLGTAATGQGYRVAVQYTGTILGNTSGGGVLSSNGTAAAVATTVGGTLLEAAISDTTGDFVNLDFAIQTNANGTIGIAFAQDSSSTSATVMKAGSLMTVTRLL